MVSLCGLSLHSGPDMLDVMIHTVTGMVDVTVQAVNKIVVRPVGYHSAAGSGPSDPGGSAVIVASSPDSSRFHMS